MQLRNDNIRNLDISTSASCSAVPRTARDTLALAVSVAAGSVGADVRHTNP